jgi:phage terminase large subunit GpA-like protein
MSASVLAGQWIPRAPGHGGGVIRSYAINSLSYPFGWPGNAWPNLAEEWEVKHLDPTRLKTFVNLKLGEPWRDPEESRGDADSLMSRREAYGPEIPAAVGVLTAAVDVQANRLEAELCGWGKDEESWSIEYRVFPGNTTQPAVWEELDKWLQGSWLSENGLELSIRAVGVDAAYNTEAVRKFCASRSGRRVWPLQGKAGDRAACPTKTPRQRGKYPPPFTIGVDTIKEIVYARLRIMDPGPGFCHFPSNYDRDYFDMLTAEVRVPDYTTPIPKYVWRKKSVSARNESLDLRVYNYAVLVGLTMTSSFRLNAEVAALERRAQQGPRVSAPSPNKPADEWLKGDRGKGWFS